MPKERNVNPVQAAHKADKARALKKSKASQQAQRNEKLARRNPERLQRQIDDLKALSQTQQLRPKDKQTLDALERDLKAVGKAREALGDKAPKFARRRDDGGPRGEKRRRDDESETDEDVRSIPMPRDTPPPVPRRHQPSQQQEPKPAQPAQTVYSSAPVMRNLAQESKRFVPAAVAQNLARTKGHSGRLLEPEEMDRLEKAGYRDATKAADEAEKEVEYEMMNAEERDHMKSEALRDVAGVADEAEKEVEFELMSKGKSGDVDKELRHVEMEEVPDEDL